MWGHGDVVEVREMWRKVWGSRLRYGKGRCGESVERCVGAWGSVGGGVGSVEKCGGSVLG